jgi:GST-like protein
MRAITVHSDHERAYENPREKRRIRFHPHPGNNTPMIDLYGMTSPNVRKIFIGLEELELPYEFHHVRVLQGDQFDPEFTRLNPNSKVPVIVDRDGPGGRPYTVFESGAILLYLAEKTGRLLPADLAARHTAIQWLMIQMANVGPMFGQLNHFRLYAPAGNEYSLKRYETEARRIYDMLDTRLAHLPFLAGEEYTIADVATFPWGLYHVNHGLDWSEHPNLKRWCDVIGERPAVQRALAKVAAIEPMDAKTMENATEASLDRFYNRSWMREQKQPR